MITGFLKDDRVKPTSGRRKNLRGVLARWAWVPLEHWEAVLEQTDVERVVHECRENNTICRFPSIPTAEHSVVFNCACDACACVVLHTSESLMMLCTSEKMNEWKPFS